MSSNTPALIMAGLDVLMIAYTYWILGLAKVAPGVKTGVTTALLGWLAVLSWFWILSGGESLPTSVPGPLFLALIVGFVGVLGTVILGPKPVRNLALNLDQVHLLLPQGIRVFFGATFLMNAATGVMPKTFGIIDGYTHITAGFLGLYAAYAVTKDPKNMGPVWIANLWGLVDILVVASTISLVLLPEITPRHSVMLAVFLPAPIWMWCHFLSIWRTMRAAEPVSERELNLGRATSLTR